MTYIKVPVPRFDVGLVSNLFGMIGLVLIVIAPGGLTGNWWWSVLVGGLAGVLLSYLTALRQSEVAEDADTTMTKRDIRLAR